MISQKDQELLALLRMDARAPVAALARKLGLSRSTVNDRLRNLEKTGVVVGYTVKLRSDNPLGGFSAFITLGAEPRRQLDVAKAIRRIAQVETLHAVSGKYDFMAKARTQTAEDMDKLIDELTVIPGVNDIETFTEGIFAQMHPIGRVGQPEEVGRAVAFLLSDEAAFITGVALSVDGGLNAVFGGISTPGENPLEKING